MKAQWFVILPSLVGSLLLPIGPTSASSTDVAGEDGESKLTGLRKSVEISIAPDKIAWVKIDASGHLEMQAFYDKVFLFHQESKPFSRRIKPYTEPLPLESQHTDDEMAKLRKDEAKWTTTYMQELRTVLKDQYYVWKEIHRIAEALDDTGRKLGKTRQWYTLKISLKDGVNGVEQMEYDTESYLDAKTIAEDLRKGVIKSLTVYTENPRERDIVEDKWVPCDRLCQISAFGY